MEQVVTTTSGLRKRTHPTVSGNLTGLVADTSVPSSSQLPSPLSSVDETMKMVVEESGNSDIFPTQSVTRRRRSTMKGIRKARSSSNIKDSSTSDRMDIPLAVALLPPLGSFLTGGDFLRDFLLFLLLFFYLHQVCKQPLFPSGNCTHATHGLSLLNVGVIYVINPILLMFVF